MAPRLLRAPGMKTYLLYLTPLFSIALAGCRADQPPATPENPAPVTNTSAGATVSSTSPGAKATGSTTSTSSAPEPIATATPAPADPTPAAVLTVPTDDEILQVTHTANLGEIEQATLALSKAKDARVRQLAKMMIKDHTAADARGMTLVKIAGLNPVTSEMSTSLAIEARAATSALRSQAAADFDKAYVDTQVREHQSVLDTIDQKLMPAARGADLRTYLGEVRPKIAMHLQHALDLQKAMQK